MRFIVPFFLLAAPVALPAQPGPPPPARDSLFISPMGEPFRSDRPGADNIGTWFAAADRDGDRALTQAELRADSERFFALLDTDRDNELEMSEIARYENEIAPEVQVGLQMRETGIGDWRGGKRRRVLVFERGVNGAGRFAFLNIPHPVMAADDDLNRGVSRAEFAIASDQRIRASRQGSRRPPRPCRATASASASSPPAGQRERQSFRQAEGDAAELAGSSVGMNRSPTVRPRACRRDRSLVFSESKD